jgi:hypothetical protein
MTTDISDKGLESLIVRHMTGTDGLTVAHLGATSQACLIFPIWVGSFPKWERQAAPPRHR